MTSTPSPRKDWPDAPQGSARFLVTQDLDFSDTRSFRPGTHCGLLVRLRDPTRLRLIEFVRALFRAEEVQSRSGCFVVATERKLRIQRPDSTAGDTSEAQSPP